MDYYILNHNNINTIFNILVYSLHNFILFIILIYSLHNFNIFNILVTYYINII
jgi:hypothetical protein